MEPPSGIRDDFDGGIFQYRRCRCGFRAVRYTSWTDDNPGRRFVKCPDIGGKKCGFWEWIDPEVCYRSKQIIPGLLRQLNRLEKTNQENQLDIDGLRLLLMKCYSESDELRAKIEDYEIAIMESTRKGKKYMFFSMFMFAILVCRLFS